MTQLAGGVTRPLDALRDDLLNLLADVEAGLDFVDEDISFVGRDDLLKRLANGLAQLTLVRKQLEGRGRTDRPFRAVLVGRPNAGKSSLYNALTGAAPDAGAIVSPIPGTTRDYLVQRLELDGVTIEVLDTAGRQTARDEIDAQSQELGRHVAERADLVLVCIPAGAEPDAAEKLLLETSSTVAIATQCDLTVAPAGRLATSAVTGHGLNDLPALLAERTRTKREPPLAPSLSRCRHHVEACLEHLRKARSTPCCSTTRPKFWHWNCGTDWKNWAPSSEPFTRMICWIAFSADFASENEAEINRSGRGGTQRRTVVVFSSASSAVNSLS